MPKIWRKISKRKLGENVKLFQVEKIISANIRKLLGKKKQRSTKIFCQGRKAKKCVCINPPAVGGQSHLRPQTFAQDIVGGGEFLEAADISRYFLFFFHGDTSNRGMEDET